MTHRKAIFIVLFLSKHLSAHPHMAIHTSCEFVFHDSNLKGVWVQYKFDRYFTSDLLYSFDLDQNSQFDTDETAEVYNNAFINLKNFGFFISIRKGEDRSSPEKVEQFSVFLDKERIVYRFYVSINGMKNGEIFLSVYDPTYFCSIFYREEDPVIFSGTGNPFNYEILENRDYPVFYNPAAPMGSKTTYDTWQPGLQTYYPEEIHLFRQDPPTP